MVGGLSTAKGSNACQKCQDGVSQKIHPNNMVHRVTVLHTAPAAGGGAASIAPSPANVVSMATAPVVSPAHTNNESIAADAQMKMSARDSGVADIGNTPLPGGHPSPANESISSIDDNAQIVMAAAAFGE